MHIYISRSGTQEGPFTIVEVNALLKDVSLTVSDYAWYEGLNDWVMVQDMADVLMPEPEMLSNQQTDPENMSILIDDISITNQSKKTS